MRLDLFPSLALVFYCVTFVAEKILLRGRVAGAGAARDKGSLAAYLVTGALSVPAGIVIGFTDYGRVEEAALREHFGEDYIAYARETRRLVPGLY